MESLYHFFPENVAKELKKAEFVTRTERKEIKESIPHYFLWTSEECVASSFAKEFAKIVSKGYVYPDLPDDCDEATMADVIVTFALNPNKVSFEFYPAYLS